jgi:hypothetical protein
MWQRWFKNQCVAVGWGSRKLNETTKGGRGWSVACKFIKEMEAGDLIIVTLKGHKIGRLAEIVKKRIKDDQWNPLVPPGPHIPLGDLGRRILVRWELTTGPDDPDMVIRVPHKCEFTNGELRPAISKIRSQTISKVRSLMNDPRNWVGLLGKFRYEQALSDYIATYAHHLEDGLTQHPNLKIRELVFKDNTRSDVLLLDRNENPLVVECKQHPASVKHIKQLRQYVLKVKKLTRHRTRGILVHSGAQKLTADVVYEAKRQPMIEIVCYRLRVDFTRSTT